MSYRFAVVFDNPTFSDRTLSWKVTDADLCADEKDKAGEKWSSSFSSSEGSGGSSADGHCATRVHISRAILASSSPYFEKLFSCGMRESMKGGTEDIILQVSRKEAAVMRLFLLLCYTDVLPAPLSCEQLLNLIALGNRFEVASCVKQCCIRLADLALSLTQSVALMNMAETLGHHDCFIELLDSSCIAGELWDFEAFSESDLFFHFNRFGLSAYLQRDALVVESEELVFERVSEWAEYRYAEISTRQAALDVVMPSIRFPSMDVDYLQAVADKPEMQTKDNIALLIQALAFKSCSPQRKEELVNCGPQDQTWYLERHSRHPSTEVIHLPEDVDATDYGMPGHHYMIVRIRKLDLEALDDGDQLTSKWGHVGGVSFRLEIIRKECYFYWVLRAALRMPVEEKYRVIKASLAVKNSTSAQQSGVLDLSSKQTERELHFPDFCMGSREDLLRSPRMFFKGVMVVVANLFC